MKKAIIFDLDGTLWDSSESVCGSWNEVFRRYPEIDRVLTPGGHPRIHGKDAGANIPHRAAGHPR